jgi:hypothetical protein
MSRTRQPVRSGAACSNVASSRNGNGEMKGRQSLVPDGRVGRQDLAQVGGAADRAGALVTEQVRSIIEAADKEADEIRRGAERDAEVIRHEAADAGNRVLARFDAIEQPLRELVGSLRSEADSLTTDLSRR